MALRHNLETKTEQVLHTAVASFAFPTAATDGAAINGDYFSKAPDVSNPGAWRHKGIGDAHVDAIIFFETSVAQTFSGALGLYGFRIDTGKWYLLGALNNGTAIPTLGASTGFAATIQFVGGFDRLAVGPLTAVAVTPGAGTATVKACQIRTKEER